MVGRLSVILKMLNIGIQTAQSILGRNITLNTKITEEQFRVLENNVRNLSFRHTISPQKPISPPEEYLQGVPEEIYDKSVQGKKQNNKVRKKLKKLKLGNFTPQASTSKKGSAKYSDPYSLQLLKSNLASKYKGYIYGLSDW